MEKVVEKFQQQLARVQGLAHIDEDWGQLDFYDNFPPVKFPCALIDIQSGQFTDDGELRQRGVLTVAVKLYLLRVGNTSEKAPQSQKNAVQKGWEIYRQINRALHGQDFLPEGFGAPMRTSMQRVRRRDGIYQRDIIYTVGMVDTSCVDDHNMTKNVKPAITVSIVRE